ncbi:MAG: hypothetical protein ABF263_00450 [Polaribacter sp.]
MKKILYYDNWDKGYRNFLRLDPLFKEKGYETLLLHTTSFVEPVKKIEKEIEGLKFRDLSFYKTIRLKSIIKQESPDAIIMLNNSFLIDRALIKISKTLNIPIFHLSHGMLIPSDSIQVVKNIIKKSGGNNLFTKFNKKNRYALYNYFIELSSISKTINFFFKAIKNHTQFTQFPIYSSELDVNKSFVFYPSDLDIMVNEFGFPEEKIEVVGNPELDAFINSELKYKKEFCKKELNLYSEDYVSYFDDGLSEVHGWDSEKWMLFLKDLNGIILEKKHQLVIKLHPRRDISDCITFFKENNIKYVLDVDFKNFIHHSKFVVSHFSSVIVYALLNKKIVKSPRWGISKGLEEKYPSNVVKYFYKKEIFDADFFETEINDQIIDDYLLKSIGHIDGKARKRIINGIIKYI